MLVNNGYKIVDLGKDVDPEVIVQAIKDNKAALVGICSLMTTTMPQIDNTIAAIRAAGLKTKVMVGGAVVSQDYADQAGADIYAKDGIAAVNHAIDFFETQEIYCIVTRYMMTLKEKHQQGQFTITVELDPPKSSYAEKTFEQAARLKGNVDAINIADSPMSKMRMSPISLSYLLQHNKEIETIFHLTCRDRNIIGLQSELLGEAALCLHNILTLTGDKPDKGDHPFAQSLFEVDCMGLLNIAKTLNAGKDLAGND